MPNRKGERKFEDIDLNDLEGEALDFDDELYERLFERGVPVTDLANREAISGYTRWLNEHGKNPDTSAIT